MDLEEIYSCCIDKIENWKYKNLIPQDLNATLLFGMTNKVYKIEQSSKAVPKAVIFRVFPTVNKIINQELISKIFFACAESNIGPKIIYDQTPRYRIEEYLEGRNLTFMELNNKLIVESFAKKICDFHNNQTLKQILIDFDNRKPFALAVLDNWYNTFKKEFPTYLSKVKLPRNKFILEQLSYLLTEEFLKDYYELLPSNDPQIVASHNDINENNLMILHNNKSKFYLIDYEYSHLNFRGYDLSLYLAESKMDYSNPDFPNFTYYEDAYLTDENFDAMIKSYLSHYYYNYYNGKEAKQFDQFMKEEIPLLKAEVKKFEPINDIIWGIWGMLVVDWENLDEKCYNFEYSFHKLELFQKLRENLKKEGILQ